MSVCANQFSNAQFSFAVILQEPQQTDLNNRLNGIFDAVGTAEHIKFNVNFVQIDRIHLDESLANCEHTNFAQRNLSKFK